MITLRDITEARKRIAPVLNDTPVHTSRTLDERVGVPVYLKCENFQRVGAFKVRGAYNALAQLGPDERKRGVLTYSSGNHAQAIALAGRLLDIETTIVMPHDAPDSKRRATEGYGARVVPFDPRQTTREEVARPIAEETGAVLVPPFDHEHVIAGQGTVALEIREQAPLAVELMTPCGGGGLLGGCALAWKETYDAPGATPSRAARPVVVGVEPALADDARRSFETGVIHTIRNPPTIADGTRTPFLGDLTFPLIQKHVDAIVTVSEQSIADAVRFLFERMKLVVEPSGALGVAALLSGAHEPAGPIAVVLSGGNVDPATFASILDGTIRFRDSEYQPPVPRV
ncbi:MAG: pyridoxal-phosphate dependent enzyme [Gemmatimonadetes bacterium]|nr:pyridoxal-phosphate dependent enzyme [Gemmatimonadota bacterium]